MSMISIIVPIYNVSQYLEQCIESLVNQTFRDIEILLIDDGSTDDSGQICDLWSEKDERIIVIHQKNAGVSRARNVGIDCARGEFIVFCDSDDYLASDCCETLLTMKRGARDNFIEGGYCIVNEYGVIQKQSMSIKEDEQIDYSFVELYTKRPPSFTCNALFYADVIKENHIRFDEEVITEDSLFNLQYMRHMSCITCTGKTTYYYRVDQRVTRSKRYVGRSFKKQKEKYRFDVEFIFEKFKNEPHDCAVALAAISSTDLYFFLLALDENLARRDISKWKRLIENQRIVMDEDFQRCLQYADTRAEGARYIQCLKNKNYYLAFVIKRLATIKSKLKKVR